MSKGPWALASAARCFVSEMERRSLIRTASALGMDWRVEVARSALRACRTTEWPWSERSLAVACPMPSLDPVMKIRAIVVVVVELS